VGEGPKHQSRQEGIVSDSEQELVEFFRNERPDEGWMGDELGQSPVESAIRVMRGQAERLRELLEKYVSLGNHHDQAIKNIADARRALAEISGFPEQLGLVAQARHVAQRLSEVPISRITGKPLTQADADALYSMIDELAKARSSHREKKSA
jgi:hypothetical protein